MTHNLRLAGNGLTIEKPLFSGSNPCRTANLSNENNGLTDVCTEFAQQSTRTADRRVRFPSPSDTAPARRRFTRQRESLLIIASLTLRQANGGCKPSLSAVRHDRILKEFYLRLLAAGKKPLVAMTACMRKLVILMNRLLKKDHSLLAN